MERLEIIQEFSFSESWFPKTMEIASKYRLLLRNELRPFPKSWPFEDRVLSWLLPSLRKDIRKYHIKKGPQLFELFNDVQLDHFDEDLSKIIYGKIGRPTNKSKGSHYSVLIKKLFIPVIERVHRIPKGK